MLPKPNFIRDFCLLESGSEVQELYALWTSLAGVSCMLGRRCWLKAGRMTIYPNVMVVFVAEPGDRKSTPIVHLKEHLWGLPLELQPNMIPDQTTPPHLVQVMNRKTGQNALQSHSEGFGFISEFTNFLNKGTFEAGISDLLNDIYDCTTHRKGTIIRGDETVTDPCFGLLGATTVDGIRRAIPEGAVGTGCTSRIIFVHTEGRTGPVPVPTYSNEQTQALARVPSHLLRLSQLRGEFTLSPQVFLEHCREYCKFWNSPFYNSPTLHGYAQRRDKHLLKVAMLFAAGYDSTSVDMGHFESAKSLLLKSEAVMPQIMNKITSSAEGNNVAFVLGIVRASGETAVSRKELLRTVVYRISSRELEEILTDLRHSGQVQATRNGDDWWFKVPR